jgi:hypothetical protein
MVITRGDDLGGAQMHISALADGLLGAGHQVHVITGVAGLWAGMMYEAGVPIQIEEGMLREINPLKDIEVVRRLSRRLKALQPDLVCAHSSKAGMLARAAAKLAGIPCIFTAHGWAFTDGIPQPKKSIFRALEFLTAPLATKIVCVSDFDRNIAMRAGIKPSRLVTIHNGFAPRPAGQRRPGSRDHGCPLRRSEESGSPDPGRQRTTANRAQLRWRWSPACIGQGIGPHAGH